MNPNYYGEYQIALTTWLRQYNKKAILNPHDALTDFTVFTYECRNIPRKYLRTIGLMAKLLDTIVHLSIANHPRGGTFTVLVVYGYSSDVNNYSRLIKRLIDNEKPYKLHMKKEFKKWKRKMIRNRPSLDGFFPHATRYLEEIVLIEVKSLNEHINQLLDKKRMLPNYKHSNQKRSKIRKFIKDMRFKTLPLSIVNYSYLNSNNYGQFKPYFKKG